MQAEWNFSTFHLLDLCQQCQKKIPNGVLKSKKNVKRLAKNVQIDIKMSTTTKCQQITPKCPNPNSNPSPYPNYNPNKNYIYKYSNNPNCCHYFDFNHDVNHNLNIILRRRQTRILILI